MRINLINKLSYLNRKISILLFYSICLIAFSLITISNINTGIFNLNDLFYFNFLPIFFLNIIYFLTHLIFNREKFKLLSVILESIILILISFYVILLISVRINDFNYSINVYNIFITINVVFYIFLFFKIIILKFKYYSIIFFLFYLFSPFFSNLELNFIKYLPFELQINIIKNMKDNIDNTLYVGLSFLYSFVFVIIYKYFIDEED
jgi:hypothetical protein